MTDNNNSKIAVFALGLSEDNQRVARSALAKNVFECICTDDILDILSRAEQRVSSLLIVDIDSFRDDIADVVDSFISQKSGISCVALCEDVSSGSVANLLSLGFEGIVAKPLDPERLRLTLMTSASRHSKLLDLGYELSDLSARHNELQNRYNDIGREMSQNSLDTIKAFLGVLETRYRYLGSHSKRVAVFSRAISDRYELNDRIRYEIEIGALLHDVGKIALPEPLLDKTREYFSTTQLNPKEHQLYRKHPIVGQEAVNMLEMLKHVGIYIRHHHERFDGNGYPDGLKGRYIPLGARIITVVDAYDRIVFGADKRLRDSAQDLFLKYLEKHKSIIYDPETADMLVEYIESLKNEKNALVRQMSLSSLEPGMILASDILTSNGVLLYSQYEILTPKDLTRLRLFYNSRAISDKVEVYGQSRKSRTSDSQRPDDSELLKEVTHRNFVSLCADIAATESLKTLPVIYTNVMSKLSDPDCTREDIAEIIRNDQVIVSKLLRLVNSPLFGFTRRITTIEDAIPLLGFNEIRNIVTSLSIIKLVSDTGSDSGFDRVAFWRHSIGSAIICELIARNIGVESGNEFFTAALLHDIGRLVLDQLYPDDFQLVLENFKSETLYLRQAERIAFGAPHQHIGEYLLSRWRLPDILCDAVKNHHAPLDSTVDPLLVSAVHIADIIAHMLHIGKSGERSIPSLDSFAEQRLGISLNDIDILMPNIEDKIKQSEDILSLGE